MATPPTILAVKQAFLDRETRQLAQPLEPSRAWRRANDSRRAHAAAAAENRENKAARRLPDKAVDDALFRANQLLQQHVRRVYAPAAARHVAEQLDQLYWAAAERAVEDGGMVEGLSGELCLGVDFTSSSAIAALPPAWEDARAVEEMPLEAQRYAELVVRLQDLAAQRTVAEARVQRLRRIKALLAPLDETAAAETPSPQRQDNLVTRNGPVERELERMRLLLARVGSRVAALPRQDDRRSGSGSSKSDDVEAMQQKQVQALLKLF